MRVPSLPRLASRPRAFLRVTTLTMLGTPTLCAVLASENLGDCAVQFGLGLSAAICLYFLARTPLLNPVQSFVLIVYMWLGFGPCVMYLWSELIRASQNPLAGNLAASTPAAALAACGLPLYAACASAVMSWVDAKQRFRRGFSLGSQREQSTVLFVATLLWLTALLTSMLLGAQEQVPGMFESVGMLGGSRVRSWWLGLVLACQNIGPWVLSTLMWYVAQPRFRRPAGTELMALPTVAVMVLNALVGGWKSPLVTLVGLYAIARTCRQQRPPWLLGTAFVVVFLVVITPFVTIGRLDAEASGATSNSRAAFFLDLAARPGDWFGRADVVEIDVLFRGISWVGSEAVRRGELLHGPWGSHTVTWGMEVLVPRPLLPTKRDMNIGNFVAREIGVDLEMSHPLDEVNSLAIFIPCEVAVSFGWIAAWLSFGLIGVAWSLASCAVLGSRTLANHPFCPLLVMLPLSMEAPIGHFLPHMRGLLFGLIAMLAIRWAVVGLSRATRPMPPGAYSGSVS